MKQKKKMTLQEYREMKFNDPYKPVVITPSKKITAPKKEVILCQEFVIAYMGKQLATP